MLRCWQTRTKCCGRKCFPVCPRAQRLFAHTKFVSDFFQNHFVSATNASRFAQNVTKLFFFCFVLVCPPKKTVIMSNNVLSFGTAFRLCHTVVVCLSRPLVNSWAFSVETKEQGQTI